VCTAYQPWWFANALQIFFFTSIFRLFTRFVLLISAVFLWSSAYLLGILFETLLVRSCGRVFLFFCFFPSRLGHWCWGAQRLYFSGMSMEPGPSGIIVTFLEFWLTSDL